LFSVVKQYGSIVKHLKRKRRKTKTQEENMVLFSAIRCFFFQQSAHCVGWKLGLKLPKNVMKQLQPRSEVP